VRPRLPLRLEFVERHETGSPDVYEVRDANGNVLLSDQTYYPTAPSLKVAEWLVDVANAHGEMLAALKQADCRCDEVWEIPRPPGRCYRCAALALAEGRK
jgi:hypothetical protein